MAGSPGGQWIWYVRHTALHTMCNATLITDVSTHPVWTFKMSLPQLTNTGHAITIFILFIVTYSSIHVPSH